MTGRKEYDKIYHPKLLLDLLSAGKHYVSFIREVMVTRDTFMAWVDKYPEFEEAFRIGESMAYDWWLDLGMINAENEAWDNTVWKYTMNTRFRPFTQGIYIKGFKALKNAKQQHKVLLDAATSAQVTAREANQLCDLVEAGQRIETNSDLMTRIEALEKRGVS